MSVAGVGYRFEYVSGVVRAGALFWVFIQGLNRGPSGESMRARILVCNQDGTGLYPTDGVLFDSQDATLGPAEAWLGSKEISAYEGAWRSGYRSSPPR